MLIRHNGGAGLLRPNSPIYILFWKMVLYIILKLAKTNYLGAFIALNLGLGPEQKIEYFLFTSSEQEELFTNSRSWRRCCYIAASETLKWCIRTGLMSLGLRPALWASFIVRTRSTPLSPSPRHESTTVSATVVTAPMNRRRENARLADLMGLEP